MVISFYQDFTSSFHCGDCYYERDTGIGDFEERDSGNNHLNEPREPGCPLTRVYTGSLALERRSGCSATLFSYCAGTKIL